MAKRILLNHYSTDTDHIKEGAVPKGRGRPERVQGSGLKCGVTGPVAISVSTPTPERSRVPGAGTTYFWELHPIKDFVALIGGGWLSMLTS